MRLQNADGTVAEFIAWDFQPEVSLALVLLDDGTFAEWKIGLCRVVKDGKTSNNEVAATTGEPSDHKGPSLADNASLTDRRAVPLAKPPADNPPQLAMPCELFPHCPEFSITDHKNRGRDCGVCERIRKSQQA